jgi:hypothetical protein
VDEQRRVDVLLYDVCPLTAGAVADQCLQIFDRVDYIDALSTIGILTRLYYPDVVWRLELCFYRGDLLDHFFCLRVFTFVHALLPSLFLINFNGSFPLFVHRFDFLLERAEVALKKLVVGIVHAVLSVESQWQHLERVLAKHFVISTHVDKQTFLVC